MIWLLIRVELVEKPEYEDRCHPPSDHGIKAHERIAEQASGEPEGQESKDLAFGTEVVGTHKLFGLSHFKWTDCVARIWRVPINHRSGQVVWLWNEVNQKRIDFIESKACLLYTSDAADE